MKNTRKMGRPKKSPAETLSISVILRLAPSEKQAFQDTAGVAGIPVAAWMRERLRKAATLELEDANRANPMLLIKEGE